MEFEYSFLEDTPEAIANEMKIELQIDTNTAKEIANQIHQELRARSVTYRTSSLTVGLDANVSEHSSTFAPKSISGESDNNFSIIEKDDTQDLIELIESDTPRSPLTVVVQQRALQKSSSESTTGVGGVSLSPPSSPPPITVSSSSSFLFAGGSSHYGPAAGPSLLGNSALHNSLSNLSTVPVQNLFPSSSSSPSALLSGQLQQQHQIQQSQSQPQSQPQPHQHQQSAAFSIEEMSRRQLEQFSLKK